MRSVWVPFVTVFRHEIPHAFLLQTKKQRKSCSLLSRWCSCSQGGIWYVYVSFVEGNFNFAVINIRFDPFLMNQSPLLLYYPDPPRPRFFPGHATIPSISTPVPPKLSTVSATLKTQKAWRKLPPGWVLIIFSQSPEGKAGKYPPWNRLKLLPFSTRPSCFLDISIHMAFNKNRWIKGTLEVNCETSYALILGQVNTMFSQMVVQGWSTMV